METVTKSIILRPKSPYNIKQHLENYGFKEPLPEIYDDGNWRRALRLKNGKLIPVEVEINRDANKPELKILIHSKITRSEETEIVEKIKWIFNTESDLKPLYKFMDSDPILRRVKENNYGLKHCSYSTVFEGIINTIIQQQISLKVAFHMTSLLVKKFGEHILINNKEFWEFPLPERLADATVEDVKSCKLSRRKTEYIINFSRAVTEEEFDPESLKKLNYNQITKKLMQFKGLGRWTVEIVIVTSIGLEGVSPAGDLGVRKAISHFYNNDKLMSEDDVRKLTDKWGKYNGIITYYLLTETLH